MKNVIVIKNKSDISKLDPDILKLARESYEMQIERHYNPPHDAESDRKQLVQIINSQCFVIFVNYHNKGTVEITSKGVSTCEIDQIYLGTGTVGDTCSIHYIIQKEVSSPSAIANLVDNIELDLDRDYGYKSYMLISQVSPFASNISDLLSKEPVINSRPTLYSDNWCKYELATYAQHNENCKRMYNSPSSDDERSEFQRDRERIVNCKSFRRMVDKAQIFSAQKGDHYRTRMTHTLEVNQIAKAIAGALQLNIDLTEAIALGHDLGHTPFGHQGERTLDNILCGKKCKKFLHMEDTFFEKNLLGRFKHNYQGLRILSRLENKYVDFNGLNVSFQVLEGILKHTSLKKEIDLADFIDKDFIDDLSPELSYCTTLEGQVVLLADEIAQRGHDIDDALTSGLISCDELLSILTINRFSLLFHKLNTEYQQLKIGTRFYEDEQELITQRMVSQIVSYFINDVIVESKSTLQMNTTNKVDRKLITMSSDGECACKYLEKIINKKVISNSEVAKFDRNADVIITNLFVLYYQNPLLLHKGTLRKIYRDMLENDETQKNALPLYDSNLDLARHEIETITRTYLIYTEPMTNDSSEIFIKRKILIRNIIDYIAGMTDSYAISEYNKIK